MLRRSIAATIVALAALAPEPASAQTLSPVTSVPTQPGRYTRAFEHAGLGRTYIIAIPRSYDRTRPAPLLLVHHGHGQHARTFANRHPDLFTNAEAAGFILVLPQATTIADPEDKPRWITTPDPFGVDDQGFILALIDRIARSLTVDRRRVYAAGFSNGGGFTHYLGATRPDVFAAISIVASGLGVTAATPLEPIPALLVYGRRDRTRPYDGGFSDLGFPIPPAPEVAESLARTDGCLPAPVRTAPNPGVTVDRYTGCLDGTEVIFVTVDRMDHSWPDAADGWGFDMNRAVIAFCRNHHN